MIVNGTCHRACNFSNNLNGSVAEVSLFVDSPSMIMYMDVVVVVVVVCVCVCVSVCLCVCVCVCIYSP